MSSTNITIEKIREVVLDAIQSPEEVQNDSGRVESRPLDELVEALKYANKLEAASDPFKCLRQRSMRHKDVWR